MFTAFTVAGMKTMVCVAVLISARAVLAQGTLNLSQDLVRLGIASSNMTPNQPGLDSAPLFSKAAIYLRNDSVRRVIADPGAYYFRSVGTGKAHVLLNVLTNVTIDLQGSDLYFGLPFNDGILVANSSNLVLKNFTADYDPLPFTQVRVVSVDAAQRTIHFSVEPGCQDASALNAVFAAVPDVGSVEIHVYRSGHLVAGIQRMYAVNPVGSDQVTIAGDVTTSALMGLIRPGDIVFLGMRTGRAGALRLDKCTGCTFQNIKVYSSVEYGIGGGGGATAFLTTPTPCRSPGRIVWPALTDSSREQLGDRTTGSG